MAILWLDDLDKSMGAILTTFSLAELYQMQSETEARLAELRASEPSPKRKNEKEHSIWFAICQSEIVRLHNIRNAIIDAKNKEGSA